MKSSFFFVLWIIIYPLIGIFGTPYMIEHSFMVALIAVFVINWICNSQFSGIFEQIKERETVSFYELVYTTKQDREDESAQSQVFVDGNPKLKNALKRGYLFPLASSIYLVLSVIALVIIRVPIWEVVIFAFLAIASCSETYAKYRVYKDFRSGGTIPIPEDLEESYSEYERLRETYTYEELCPAVTTGYKIMRGANYVFSVLAVLLGLIMLMIYLPMLFVPDIPVMVVSMMVSYGLLAVLYGVRDFLSTYKGYSLSI